jgi:hypothetical protein
MKKNVGTIDRAIRAVVGIAAIAAYFVGWLTGTLAIIALVVGIVLLGTAAIRWCPPYDLLGINTGSKAND